MKRLLLRWQRVEQHYMHCHPVELRLEDLSYHGIAMGDSQEEDGIATIKVLRLMDIRMKKYRRILPMEI